MRTGRMARSGKLLRDRRAADSIQTSAPSRTPLYHESKSVGGSFPRLAAQYHLTEREGQALEGISAGLTTKEIAAGMNISPNTVRSLLRAVMLKMDVATHVALVAKLLADGADHGGGSSLDLPAGRHGDSGVDAGIPRAIIARAVHVIGDRTEAFRWLGTPVRALGYQTPIAVSATPDGERSVLAVLDQLEHGVY